MRQAWLRNARRMVIALAFIPVWGMVSWHVGGAHAADSPPGAAPVLVELFTSEGCSSCPPADALLAQIAREQPNVIVLSEHVTYWNQIGWKDPFSSDASTERQADYVQRMRLSSNYTPQMVVNGHYEFVGSDERSASQAIKRAAAEARTPVSISKLMVENRHVHFDVTVGDVNKDAQLVAVLAQNEGSKYVSSGENGGHLLRHVRIARSFRQVAEVKSGEGFQGSMSVDLPDAIAGKGWRLVVFLQQGSGGPILGAASEPI